MDKADEIWASGRQQSWEPGSHGEESLQSCPHERSANSAAAATAKEQMLFHMTDDGTAFDVFSGTRKMMHMLNVSLLNTMNSCKRYPTSM
jgi:hypothetical protein